MWHEIFGRLYFCGLAIFCVLRELIFAIRTEWFFLLGINFCDFRKYPVPSIDNIFKIRKLRLTLLRSKVKKEIHTFCLSGRRNYKSPGKACSSTPRLYRWRGTFALKRGQKWKSPKLQFYFINVLAHSVEEFSPSFPNARGRITWRDMLCMTGLKAGLPVAVRQLLSFCPGGKLNWYS